MEVKDNKNEQLDAGQLALRCAQFFMALGQSCLEFYHKYNKEKERKTKTIKKNQKQKPRATRRGEPGEQDLLNEQMKKKLPKKPLTAYIIYFQQKKPNFVEKYPGLNLSDLTKLIAKEWKQIDNNQRKPYLEQAQEDRKRYDTEMKEFKQNYGTVAVNNDEQEENGIIEAEGLEQVNLNQINPELPLENKASDKVQPDDDNMEEQKPQYSVQNDQDAENQENDQGAQGQNESNQNQEQSEQKQQQN